MDDHTADGAGGPGALPESPRADLAAGELVTETLDYDGGRQVTVYVPPDPPRAVVFAGDGQGVPRWGGALEAASVPSTMIVGVHGLADETLRLQEYSPVFDPERFAAHERFFVEDVGRWARSRFGVALPAGRTAVFGVSAGGELALALGLRHPDVYGAVFSGSPGAGYKPAGVLPDRIPRTYLVAGTLEPFFLSNATRWAAALRDERAVRVTRRRAMAGRVPADGGMGVRAMKCRAARSAVAPSCRRRSGCSTAADTRGRRLPRHASRSLVPGWRGQNWRTSI